MSQVGHLLASGSNDTAGDLRREMAAEWWLIVVGLFFLELLGASLLFVFFVVEFWRSTLLHHTFMS